jgi:hypothetical protein
MGKTRMKLKSLILVAIVGVIGLAGCKPKETTIPGQVFIATSGRENIRLGAVEVLLIERQQVTNYLQKRQAVNSDKKKLATRAMLETRQRDVANAESQVKTCQNNVANEEQNVEDAQKQFDPVKKEYEQFMATQPLLTNAVYVKIKKDITFRTQIIPSQQQTITFLEEEVNKPYLPQTWVQDYNGVNGTSGHWAGATQAEQLIEKQAVGKRLTDAKNDLDNTYARINADQQALEKIENGVDEFQANKLHDAESLLNAAKSRLTQAQSRLDAAKSHLETIKNKPPFVPTPPTVDDYFYGFTPTAVKKANTDADGNFSLTYPCNKRFTIFARAERAILSEHEKYFWLIDAPVKTEAGRVLLNNNNLIEVDPDGYFKTILMKN